MAATVFFFDQEMTIGHRYDDVAQPMGVVARIGPGSKSQRMIRTTSSSRSVVGMAGGRALYLLMTLFTE